MPPCRTGAGWPSAPGGSASHPPSGRGRRFIPTPTAAATATALGTARITLQVPANAKVWVDDLPTSQTGAVREFVTPGVLEPSKTYRYTIRAQWEENGQTVTRERTVEFQSGSAVIVNLAIDSKVNGL